MSNSTRQPSVQAAVLAVYLKQVLIERDTTERHPSLS